MKKKKPNILFDRKNDPREIQNIASDDTFKKIKEQLKHELLQYLETESAFEAFEMIDDELDWKKYQALDMSYLDDPDAKLLKQDSDLEPFSVEGYV